MPTTLCSDFILKKKLNEGRYSQVWTAHWVKKNKEVVIKINTGDNQENAFNEAARLAQLQHPFIIDILHCFVVHDLVCIVLEKGEYDLMDYIERNRRLSENEARRFFHQIVQAVSFCHSNKVSHLDLKPENVFIIDGQVKLGDFELSFNWNQQKDSSYDLQIGTVYYAAPEVNMVTGPYCSWRADMWSLGVLLYVMVAGTWPYRGATYEQVEAEARRGRIFFPKTDFSPSLQDLLLRLLDRDPLRRLSCDDVLNHPWLAAAAPPRFSFRHSIPNSASEPISISNMFAASSLDMAEPPMDNNKPNNNNNNNHHHHKRTAVVEAPSSPSSSPKTHKKKKEKSKDKKETVVSPPSSLLATPIKVAQDNATSVNASKASSDPNGFQQQVPRLDLNPENLKKEESTHAKTPNATKQATTNKTPSSLSSFSSRKNLSARTPKSPIHPSHQKMFQFEGEGDGDVSPTSPSTSLPSSSVVQVISPTDCRKQASSHHRSASSSSTQILMASPRKADSRKQIKFS